jgi:hypothetical protein
MEVILDIQIRGIGWKESKNRMFSLESLPVWTWITISKE